MNPKIKIKLEKIFAATMVITVSFIILRGIFYQALNQYDVKEHKIKTKGIVIHVNGHPRNTRMKYKYRVDNDTLIGFTTVHVDLVEEIRKNCLNKTFTVYYSSENPNNSMIDLGRYNDDYKATVEFFKPY